MESLREGGYHGAMEALLFDLDGTLVDTLGDIRAALNHVLALCSCREMTEEETRTVVGRGLRNAIRGALWFSGSAFPPDEIEILHKELMDYYSAHLTVHSRVYPWIPGLIREAKERGFALGVLSNKADVLVQEIIEDLFPAGTFDFVRGLREGDSPKPRNPSVLEFRNLCAPSSGDVTILGDSEVDWETAEAFSLGRVIVTWGFRTREELSAAGCGPLADSKEEVTKLLWN